jgi:cell division protein FtsB
MFLNIMNLKLKKSKKIIILIIFVGLIITMFTSLLIRETNLNKKLLRRNAQLQKDLKVKNKDLIEITKSENQVESEINKLKNSELTELGMVFCSYKYKTRFIEKNTNLLLSPYSKSLSIGIAKAGTVVNVLYTASVDSNIDEDGDTWLLVQIPVYDTPMNYLGWIRESNTVEYTKNKIKDVVREVKTKGGLRGEIMSKQGSMVTLFLPGGDEITVDKNDVVYPKVE